MNVSVCHLGTYDRSYERGNMWMYKKGRSWQEGSRGRKVMRFVFGFSYMPVPILSWTHQNLTD